MFMSPYEREIVVVRKSAAKTRKIAVKTLLRRPRLLLADDHALLLDGLKKLLEQEYDLVGTAANGRALVAAARRLRPDIIVLDISMPRLNGIDAARQIRDALPNAKMLFLTVHADSAYVEEAFRAGALGYVLKQGAAHELFVALRKVFRGRAYVSPLIGKHLLPSLLKPAKRQGPEPRLGVRQQEVLQLVAEGRQNKEIAAVLDISIKTVEYHKSRIMSRLDIRSSAGLTRYAIKHGIVES
jgi:DNA-binding NarL/FixJ family response regulator